MQVSGQYGQQSKNPIEIVNIDAPFFVKPIQSYPVNYGPSPVQT
jgi:hypothetical protein